MVKNFFVKSLFTNDELEHLKDNFNFRKWSIQELHDGFEKAFHDYILVALSELGDGIQENQKVYIEAGFHIEKASKLLLGMPHPAGKMSLRLKQMQKTLTKLAEGKLDTSAERATRFMEKNLVRRLRDIWTANTSTNFHPGTDGLGKSPQDYLLYCFKAAAKQYPELVWFDQVDRKTADLLIKSIKR